MQQSITSRSEHYCRGKNILSVGFEAINALEKGVNVSSCIEPVYGVLNQELVREWAAYHRYIAGIQRIYLLQQPRLFFGSTNHNTLPQSLFSGTHDYVNISTQSLKQAQQDSAMRLAAALNKYPPLKA